MRFIHHILQNVNLNTMFGYPQEIHYWACSDGRTFTNKKDADYHEDFLDKLSVENQANSYTVKDENKFNGGQSNFPLYS